MYCYAIYLLNIRFNSRTFSSECLDIAEVWTLYMAKLGKNQFTINSKIERSCFMSLIYFRLWSLTHNSYKENGILVRIEWKIDLQLMDKCYGVGHFNHRLHDRCSFCVVHSCFRKWHLCRDFPRREHSILTWYDCFPLSTRFYCCRSYRATRS